MGTRQKKLFPVNLAMGGKTMSNQITRRNFLKLAGVAGLAALTPKG
jgi:hypothetical protein